MVCAQSGHKICQTVIIRNPNQTSLTIFPLFLHLTSDKMQISHLFLLLRLLPSPSMSGAPSIQDVPEDIIALLFRMLSPRDVLRTCALVCQAWHAASQSELLWKYFCLKYGASKDDTLESSWFEAFQVWGAPF